MQKVALELFTQTKNNLLLVGTFGFGMTFFIPLFSSIVNSNSDINTYSIILFLLCISVLFLKERKNKNILFDIPIQFFDMGIYSSIFVFILNIFDYFYKGSIFYTANLYLLVIFTILILVNLLLKSTKDLFGK